MQQVVSRKSAGLTLLDLTLSAVGEHLRDKDHKLHVVENKAAVIAREEKNSRRILFLYKALAILCQSNRDGRFELPALYRDVLARDFVHPSSHDRCYCPALVASEYRKLVIVETLPLLRYLVSYDVYYISLLDVVLLTILESTFTLLELVGKHFL